MTESFLLHGFLLGAGLSVDAFTVSLANGLSNPRLTRRKMCAVAGVYAVFQALMPMTGRGAIRFAAARFLWLQRWIPWAGAVLLFAIGANMILEASRPSADRLPTPLDCATLLLQGLATSVDALSVGFTIADCALCPALILSGIIAAVTFADCLAALAIGKRFGLLFARQASVCGGCILLAVGVETLLRVLP